MLLKTSLITASLVVLSACSSKPVEPTVVYESVVFYFPMLECELMTGGSIETNEQLALAYIEAKSLLTTCAKQTERYLEFVNRENSNPPLVKGN